MNESLNRDEIPRARRIDSFRRPQINFDDFLVPRSQKPTGALGDLMKLMEERSQKAQYINYIMMKYPMRYSKENLENLSLDELKQLQDALENKPTQVSLIDKITEALMNEKNTVEDEGIVYKWNLEDGNGDPYFTISEEPQPEEDGTDTGVEDASIDEMDEDLRLSLLGRELVLQRKYIIDQEQEVFEIIDIQ